MVPDCPAKSVDHLHGVGDGEGSQAGADGLSGVEGEEAREEDDDVAEHLHPDAQPTVCHVTEGRDHNFSNLTSFSLCLSALSLSHTKTITYFSNHIYHNFILL